MKRSLLLISLLIIMFAGSSFSQEVLTDEPLEINAEEWLSRFPHSFTPISFEPTSVFYSDFDNVNISNNPEPQNEPSVMISRKNPDRVVAAWRDFRTGVNPPLRRIGYSYSTDGGETWSVSQLLPQIIPNAPLSSDPVVGVDTAGNFYIYTVSLNENTGVGELWVFKSFDEGVSFNDVYEIATGPGFEDKEWAAADLNPSSPFTNNLYLSWTRFASSTEILLTKSTDAGVTWSSPVLVSDITGGVQGSFPAVAPNGDLYIVWRGFSGGTRILFDKSTDGGVTFGTDVIVSNTPGAWFPTMAVDHSGGPQDGYIYVTWNDERNGDDDVFISFSSDGGNNWSIASRINNDPVGNGKLQYWPSVAVGQNGDIAILFYDTRNTPNNSVIEAFIARSTDGGTTFTNELVSSAQSPTNIPNSDVRFGDYIQLDFYGNKIVPVWTDERAGGFDMDIYTAVIDAVIPVELVNFTARIVNGKTMLEWRTATETNNLGFEVERKLMEQDWITIGFAEGHGTTTETQIYKFIDKGIAGNLYYRLKQIDYDGSITYSEEIEVNGVTVSSIQLEQNYPNPFNPATIINYQLGNDGFVSLKIFNSLGEEVTVVIDEYQSAGSYSITFNGNDLPSGMYVYKLTSGNYSESKKMLLMK